MKKIKTHIKAFTLAEVLITLTIIGVIAAITIPNLMQKWEDNSQISAAKEAYSIIDNAVRMAVSEHGPIDEWGFPSGTYNDGTEGSVYFGEMIKPYLKVVEDCSRHRTGSCFDYDVYSLGKKSKLSLNPSQDVMRFKLANDMRITSSTIILNTSYSPSIWKEKVFNGTRVIVDTNGKKGPNRFGYDIFYFGLNRLGLAPIGIEYWNYNGDALSDYCSLDDTAPSTNPVNGNSCYYWIVKHNNMDYKRRRPAASEW